MTKTETTMVLQRVSITRAGYHGYGQVDPASPFSATIEVTGASGKVELNLSEGLSRRIVEIIADEVAAAGRATADIMVADAMIVSSNKTKALEKS